MTLKEIRKLKRISQADAAQFLGVPLRSYKRYESDSKYESNFKYSLLVESLQKYKSVSKENKIVRKLNIVVTGIGYVGLSTALVLCKKANITMFDINPDKVALINKKISPIDDESFKKEVKEANIIATTDIYTYRKADVVVIATSTDLDPSTNRLDTFSVESVVRTVRELNRRCLIVIRSTISIGLTDRLIDQYGSNIIFVPEFLRESSALTDARNPTRIIFGTSNVSKLTIKFQTLVESLLKNNEKVMYMSAKDAEATKLFSNAYLAMRIAFFNELDSFGLQNSLNVEKIVEGMGRDPRIGSSYNKPSIMFEGYCLPKDTQEIESEISDVKNNQLINSIIMSNNARLEFITDECIKRAKELTNKEEKEIIIGLYQLETKQIGKNYRSSSSLRLLKNLKERGIKVIVYDPVYLQGVKDFDEFTKKSDLIVTNKIDKRIKKYSNKLFSRAKS